MERLSSIGKRPKERGNSLQTHVTETAPVLAERRGVEEAERAALEKDREQDMVSFISRAKLFFSSFCLRCSRTTKKVGVEKEEDDFSAFPKNQNVFY